MSQDIPPFSFSGPNIVGGQSRGRSGVGYGVLLATESFGAPSPAVIPPLRYNRGMEFDPHCRRCPRLRHHLARLRERYPDYHNAPVPSFGEASARLLIVGLAPGLHGANASGRVFTGDQSGDLLFATLHRFGFCDRPASRSIDDGMRLADCRITNAVRCVPPANRPNRTELSRCGDYLRAELEMVRPHVVVALGKLAHDSVLRAVGQPLSAHRFGHGAEHRFNEGMILLDSYHCSRYNVQTRRLTPAMFDAIFARARVLL